MDNYTTSDDAYSSLDEGASRQPDSPASVESPAVPLARKRAAKKAPAKKAPAKKAPAKKAAVKKVAAKKAPAKKAPARSATTTKTPTKKAPAKKAAAPTNSAMATPADTQTPSHSQSDVAATDELTSVALAGSSGQDAEQPVPVPPRSRLAAAVAVLTAAALAFAVIAGVLWWRADDDAARRAGLARDQALLAARIGVERVSTSDYRHPGATLDAWLSVSTGTLHTQFSQSRASATKLLSEAKVITTATVLDAAVVTLSTAKGTASVIASVNLRKQPATGAAATSRNRLKASLRKVGGRWKISDLQVVSVRVS